MTSGERGAYAHCHRRDFAHPQGHQCGFGYPQGRQRGFGYLMVLFALAAMGILLASAGEVWRTSGLREKEAQLLFVGHQFRLALASYRDRSPEGAPKTPATMEDLLQDKRFPTSVPHLRRLWRDPMTNSTDWVLVKPGGRITGIHTRHSGEPLRNAHEPRDTTLGGTRSYSQWVFEATPATAAPAAAPVDNNNTASGASP